MNTIRDEVAFLRNFGKRFRRKETYLAALEDMYEEGMISREAIDQIKEEKYGIKRPKSQNKKSMPTKFNGHCGGGNDPCGGGLSFMPPRIGC